MLRTMQFQRLRWKGVYGQLINAGEDFRDHRTRNAEEVFLDGGLEAETIGGHVGAAVVSIRPHSPVFRTFALRRLPDRGDRP